MDLLLRRSRGTRPRHLLTFAGIGLAGVLGLALTGCANPVEPAEATTNAPDPARQLRPSMTRAQIETLMGKPTEVRMVSSDDGEVEILLYRRPLGSRVEGIAPTMADVPWFDPLTGELKMQKVPAPAEQRIEFEEELSVYLIKGLLADVRRSVRQMRQFSP